MGKVIIEQYIPCESFQTAKSVSGAFKDFQIRKYYFGKQKKIRICRFIKRVKEKLFTHFVIIRYLIQFDGDFNTYGYIDERTIKMYPELPAIMEKCPIDDRWEVISDYEMKNDFYSDIYYYQDFEDFYRRKLTDLLNRIDMVCKVSFSCKCNTNLFQIYYEECGTTYRRGYFANNNYEPSLFGINNLLKSCFKPIPLQMIWDWSEEHYYNSCSNWYTEARAWAALSYVLNRSGYESILYSIMGLEAVYTNGDKETGKQLRRNVPRVVNCISEDEIRKSYWIRSKFVHGVIAYPMFGQVGRDYGWNDLITKTAAALLATVQLLVTNNATRIAIVDDRISYIGEPTIRDGIKT